MKQNEMLMFADLIALICGYIYVPYVLREVIVVKSKSSWSKSAMYIQSTVLRLPNNK